MGIRFFSGSVLMLAFGLLVHPNTCSSADNQYISFTTGDSLRLSACDVQEFVWRGNIDCSYRTLEPRSGEAGAVLIHFHGAGDNAANFAKIAARIDTNFVNHLIIQAPVETTWHVDDPQTGEVRAFSGYSWVETETSAWIDGGLSLALFLVERALERVINPDSEQRPPIFVLGFRQGAGVAAAWAATHRDLVHGLILVSGYSEQTVRTLLRSGRGSLEQLPCLSLIGTEAPDAVYSGELAAGVRELGADLEVQFLERGARFSPDDYSIIREFIQSSIKRDH